jgi:ubiquinone/menaquinone biosynthesis C-methylase UbiE
MDAPIKDHNLKAAALWSSGGRAYDNISRSISGAIDHCVERLDPAIGERIADVATGTGWTSRVIARLGAHVVGVDIADGMLNAAREIAREQNLSIGYQRGDAEALPFQDGEFDAVISTFGVMFAPDQQSAASELARICRPGGRLAIAAWVPDSSAVTLRKVLEPFMAAQPTPPPPSPFVWGARDWLTSALGSAFKLGFEEGVVISRFPSAAQAWDVYTDGFGPVRAVASSLQGPRREELRKAFTSWFEQYRTGLGVSLPIEYLVTVGQRI